MNVPLSIALLTDGVGMLFMLWYICPVGKPIEDAVEMTALENPMLGGDPTPSRS
jgi:hypothetical protein